MKNFKCNSCGYIIESEELLDSFVCPKCGAKKDDFSFVKPELIKEDLDAVINSVIESSEEIISKIINDNVEDKKVKISQFNPAIMRINEKCINCGQCKKTCENVENISYDINLSKEPICVGCGQCILNCPTGALVPKYSYREVKEIIDANEMVVVALTSPAVRVSMGEHFNLDYGTNVQGKLVTSLKKLGFDYVFDTAFGADLTVLEEVTELATRIYNKENLPQFTSCCPAWVKYVEIYHPELINNLSTCKSPIGMECAIIKTYFAEKRSIDPKKIITVAITPCTSKKMEAKEYVENVDFVITASELTLLLKEEDINLSNLSESGYDNIVGEGSGAGIIFGNTGGVMEASLRSLYSVVTKKNPPKDLLQLEVVRGVDGVKTGIINIKDVKIKVAVINGISNIENFIKSGNYKKFDYIEVMNCVGGCIGGGGQPLCPIPKLEDARKKRSESLYNIDNNKTKRSSYENEQVKELFKEFLGKPLSEICIKYLHTTFSDKSGLLGKEK